MSATDRPTLSLSDSRQTPLGRARCFLRVNCANRNWLQALPVDKDPIERVVFRHTARKSRRAFCASNRRYAGDRYANTLPAFTHPVNEHIAQAHAIKVTDICLAAISEAGPNQLLRL